ncbi:MAG TPA: phage holin family protein [Alphaproteobacteria bacterium]
MAHPDQSVRSLLSELVREVTELFRQELRLARAETGEKIGQVQSGAISLLAGFLIAFVALIVLAQAMVIGLSNFVAPWLAAVIVAVVLAVIGLFLVKAGQSSLKPDNLLPERTMRTIRDDKDMLVDKVS